MTATPELYGPCSTNPRLSMVWLRSSCLRGHTCLAHQLTLTLTQHTCAQGMILQVRTAAYRCETAMGIQMSVAWRSMQWIKHAILCQWRQSIRICCGLHGALDTLRKSRPCLWNNAVSLETWTSRWKWAVRCCEGFIPSGFVKIRPPVSKLSPNKSQLKWWCTRANWLQGCLHYSWLTACSTCLRGSNC